LRCCAVRPSLMPKVIFVNEHREVDVAAGRLLSDVAKELGIQLCREELANTGFGNYSVWIQGEEGCVSPPSLWERLRGVKGWRRFANKTKVLGDVKVWSQQGIGSRVGLSRQLSPAPGAESERFVHEKSAAGTAWHPLGHPAAVGEGQRQPSKFEPPVKKQPAKAADKSKD
jgi:hypothetical protein